MRFLSFRIKRNCLKDPWFVFDSSLVFLMIMETWVFTVVLLITAGGASPSSVMNASVLRIGRLMRLSRMARMARLLRAMPELLILIKGMLAAVRSVCFTLLLLCILMYAFGIAFRQLAVDTPAGTDYFGTLLDSMHTLILKGTLLDGPSVVTSAFVEDGTWYLLALFYLYVLLSSLTVMNTLIGVLCEVVSAISETEREQMTITMVKAKLKHIMINSGIDKNNDGNISEDEFKQMLENVEAAKILQEVGVDVVGLVDVAEFIFEDVEEDEEGERNLSFPKFVDVILNLRGSNTATVKDVVDLRKFMRMSVHALDEAVHDALDGLSDEIADKGWPGEDLSPDVHDEASSAPLLATMSDRMEATLAAAQRSFQDSLSLSRIAASLALQLPESKLAPDWGGSSDAADMEAPLINACRVQEHSPLWLSSAALVCQGHSPPSLQEPSLREPPLRAGAPAERQTTPTLSAFTSEDNTKAAPTAPTEPTAPLGSRRLSLRRGSDAGGASQNGHRTSLVGASLMGAKGTLLSKSMARRAASSSNLTAAMEAKKGAASELQAEPEAL